ncbi:MAG: hypothetical protein DA330_10145, partial [Nitrososphaera sp.]|nr:hypothetical protein [Nitrososphaera sp.]
MVIDLDNTYKGLSSDYAAYKRILRLMILPTLVAFFTPLSALSLIQRPELNNLQGYALFMVVFGGSVFTIILLKKKARILSIPLQNEAAIKCYHAYRAVSKFIDDGFAISKQKEPKNALKEFLLEIREWKGHNTPKFIARPTINLIKAIEEKAIPAIEQGNKDDVKLVKETLFRLLCVLHENSSVDGLIDVIKQFENISTEEKKPKTFETE